jgi:hypothetical protein
MFASCYLKVHVLLYLITTENVKENPLAHGTHIYISVISNIFGYGKNTVFI